MIPKLIAFIAQTKIKKIPDITHHTLYSHYQHYLPQLEKLYLQAAYWHGTGRYHYKVAGDSKYDGVDHSQSYDVLGSIISAGGLTPAYDPFIFSNGTFGRSISLTPYRMYARAYAEFNMPIGTSLEYVYGTTKLWYYFLAPLQLLERNMIINIRRIFYAQTDSSFQRKGKKWFLAFQKVPPPSIIKFYTAKSDIPKNYGLLFGIKKEGVQSIPLDRYARRFETRANNLIKLKNLTHIEVPLSKVTETEEFLKKKKVNLTVIPLEIGEMYCNRFSLEKLSGID